MLDLHTSPFTPLNDLRGQLVYCESGGSVRLTMVDGVVVFRNGAMTNVDETGLLDEARDLFARKRPLIEAAARTAAGSPHAFVKKIVATARHTDVGMNRWIGTI
jgi:5-methylthioadenosine/S-adenosylhomocysteine deaminase